MLATVSGSDCRLHDPETMHRAMQSGIKDHFTRLNDAVTAIVFTREHVHPARIASEETGLRRQFIPPGRSRETDLFRIPGLQAGQDARPEGGERKAGRLAGNVIQR
jgi:hypothetical protein